MSPLDLVLRIAAVPQPDACVIRVEGELDVAGCPQLESALADAERSQARVRLVQLERAYQLAEDRLRRANPAAKPSRVPDAAGRI
jgi:hypothetical protein